MKNLYKNIISISAGLLLGYITYSSFLAYNASTLSKFKFVSLVPISYLIGISILTAIIFIVLFFLYFYKDSTITKYKFNFLKFFLVISVSFLAVWLWTWFNTNLVGSSISNSLLLPFPRYFSNIGSSIPQKKEWYYLPTSIYMNILFYIFSFLVCYKNK